MTRRYFGMLFIMITAALIIGLGYCFGAEKISHLLSQFIIVWILIGYYAGQYSTRFIKD